MSKIITSSVTDTAITGVTAPSRTFPVLNIPTDFRKTLTKNSNEVVLLNVTTSMEEKETIRIAQSDMSNVFSSGSTKPVSPLTPKDGTSLLVQLVRDVKITDSANPSATYIAPISCQLTLKVPKSEAVTADVVHGLIDRLTGVLYDSGKSQVLALLKGAIDPKGL